MPKRSIYIYGEAIGTCFYMRDADSPNNSRRAWFRCDCGEAFTAYINDVKTGKTKSCGCIQKTPNKNPNYKHGLSDSRLMRIHANILSRCYNKKVDSYNNYGGRGIVVCDEWRNDFKAFYDYVIILANALKLGYSVDRIDNDGNYEPGNVRWSTPQVQAINSRVRTDNKTGYKGISLVQQTGKYKAQIVHRKVMSIGQFETVEQAVEARNEYIIKNCLKQYPIQKIANHGKRKNNTH